MKLWNWRYHIYGKLRNKHPSLHFNSPLQIKMISNAKYMIRNKLLKSFSTNWEGLKGGVAQRWEKNCREEDGMKPDAHSSRGACPLKAWELAPPVGTGAMWYDARGPGRGVGCLTAALPMTILGSHLLTCTPPTWVKDTSPYLGTVFIR